MASEISTSYSSSARSVMGALTHRNPKQQHKRIKASSIGPCPKDSLATLDATGMALQSAQALSTFGVDRGDVDASALRRLSYQAFSLEDDRGQLKVPLVKVVESTSA
ncbi:hypothetical protein H257_18705 [Aphanomyces astaci]|uniref:Uncharacterized protein n=1 Tax=Aphanomyces astaci TaxID=112090 RepID=W4FC42_APHAT|nr:hypothetical protein H257_18705 [Aphanomyces astaci]ETV64391.1 hypothetical protein H257_18705 [Aphanomyces astaci]|eukprot:XP_009846124.1 hypothetical protein H257_18705 [Aphanomyces astaci]